MYTRKNKLKMFCIAVGLFLLCSCDDIADRQQEFYDEVNGINDRHALETSRVPDVNIDDYTPKPKGKEAREVGFIEKELDSLTGYDKHGNVTDSISYEQAEIDVDLAFRIFKNCYSGYYYFGGDEAFEKAKEQVLSDCKLAGEKLTVGTLQEALIRNLRFVKDGHFLINNWFVFNKDSYYSNEDTIFLKDENGYYAEQNGKKRYVTSINDEDKTEEYMKRSVDDKGRLIYKLGVISSEVRDTVKVVFEDGTESLVLSLSKVQDFSDEEKYSYYEENNIPIVAIRSFMDESAAEQFIETAETIKNSKVSILDLRGNFGGRSYYVTRWLNIYDPALSGYERGNIFALRHSRANSYLGHIRYKADLPEKNETVASNSLSLYRAGINQWEIEKNLSFERSENYNILFVLFDAHTCSAGEWLTAVLRNKDNVIFVGVNSNGTMIGTNQVKIVLPNSKIHIQCSNVLALIYDETVFTEETGFCPDIWVGNDSLKSTLDLISYYKLNK